MMKDKQIISAFPGASWTGLECTPTTVVAHHARDLSEANQVLLRQVIAEFGLVLYYDAHLSPIRYYTYGDFAQLLQETGNPADPRRGAAIRFLQTLGVRGVLEQYDEKTAPRH